MMLLGPNFLCRGWFMGREKLKSVISSGDYYFPGDEVVAEGAIATRARYFAGYPITPTTERITI